MPKQHRWEIKRELAAAENNLNTAQNHIVKYGYEFEQAHPEIYNKFCEIVSSLGVFKDAIAAIRESI
jgi:hypothetical protein